MKSISYSKSVKKEVPRKLDVVGIFYSDIHLTLKSPLARSDEPDWLQAMAKSLLEVKELGYHYDCPIIVSGDIFDKWNPPIELINWAIRHLPKCYAIPGQHDLCHHNYLDLKKTAYWNLVENGVITNLRPDRPEGAGSLILHSFPWGFPVTPFKGKPSTLCLNVAVIHNYIWRKKDNYSPEDSSVTKWMKRLEGYDCSVFGDNHSGFTIPQTINNGSICNCGTFYRRRSDEKDYRPFVGLLLRDGSFKKHFLDISKDILTSTCDDKEEEKLDLSSFINELSDLGDSALDFAESVKGWIRKEKPSKGIRNLLLKSLEETNES